MTKKFALFSKGTNAPFFCNKSIGHVDILIDDGFEYTVIRPLISRFEHYVTFHKSGSKLEYKYIKSGYRVIDCSNLKPDYKFGVKFSILTCVEFAKYMLGVRSFFVFTPHQLYKKLLKLNCKEIKNGVR